MLELCLRRPQIGVIGSSPFAWRNYGIITSGWNIHTGGSSLPGRIFWVTIQQDHIPPAPSPSVLHHLHHIPLRINITISSQGSAKHYYHLHQNSATTSIPLRDQHRLRVISSRQTEKPDIDSAALSSASSLLNS